ncbi:ketopantoate reductase family protein [Histidinibacterium aquaticum]|uniref:2-dehydropantoate 2-reductase n=1 Tax=Histidinibacterium aquaticum TaxID=2613962 RepID=A0A5J5GQ13_9RHOB|nr:2-dehydropantoate 2-reductase N-terminal domain-containing protein [Histidinibacterium aquaticum]KAA9009843.1 ketopantoate reductase family protein [Histidinibacterium aquaticum]
MRIIVLGLGAVGGTLAAALHAAGREVVGIARGEHLAAIRTDGLLLRTPGGSRRVPLDAVRDPTEIDWRPDDMVVVAVKTQHSAEAFDRLRAAGVHEQPVFCAQNGVENERIAARLFANVHGVCVMLPGDHSDPGEVRAYGAPKLGFFDVGRYPSGRDADDDRFAAALEGSELPAFPVADVMASKYGKLLLNLGNAVEAALGPEEKSADITGALREEAEEVFRSADIDWRDVGAGDARRDELMQISEIDGVTRIGSSSTQSLVRGAGSIESDYLNGEIVLLARLQGRDAPRNAAMARLAAELARDCKPPGSVSVEDLRRKLGI